MSDSGGSVGGLASGGGNAVGTEKNRWGLGALYLGVSWTWCIGMFLPALLWRDFGVWSFVVFALPNVVGAAAMGVVVRSPEASRVFIERHRAACAAFSIVTVVFQVFFAAWVARILGAAAGSGGWVWHAGWVACVLGAAIGGGRRWGTAVALVVWVLSIVTLVLSVARAADAGALDQLVAYRPPRPQAELAPLAMVCVLGFMLCPYLDLTFHRARIESGAAAPRAFSVGFGVVFALMILGTLLTAPVLLWLVGARVEDVDLRPLIMPLLALHTLPQLVYTCWVHGSEVRGGERAWLVAAAVVVGVGIAVVDGGVLMARRDVLYSGEVLYRVFMGFYGLVAPAYVAIVAWPVRDGGVPIRGGRLAVFAAVVVGAVWFYWLGFVERQTWWVAAGVLVVVCGKLVGRFVEYKGSTFKVQSSTSRPTSD
jgi:hypothetical protein